MHSLIHLEHARTDAAARHSRAIQRPARPPRPEPPPIRRRAAHAAGRIASRLDAETARRAVA